MLNTVVGDMSQSQQEISYCYMLFHPVTHGQIQIDCIGIASALAGPGDVSIRFKSSDYLLDSALSDAYCFSDLLDGASRTAGKIGEYVTVIGEERPIPGLLSEGLCSSSCEFGRRTGVIPSCAAIRLFDL